MVDCSEMELATLPRRASEWYAQRGLIEESLRHALRAGDTSAAVCLVEAQFLPAREREQWTLMERWLRLLAEEQIQCSPILLCARVWILQTHSQHAGIPQVLKAIEHLLAQYDNQTSREDDHLFRLLHVLVENAWGHCYFRAGQAQLSLKHIRSAMAWLPPDEEQGEIFALMYLALSSQLAGQEEVALIELDEGLRSHAQNLVSTARLLIAQGLVYLAAGKLLQAEQTAHHLQQIAREGDLTLSHNYAHWLLGVVHYEWNVLDKAIYHFTVVNSNSHLVNFWAVQDAMCGLALAYQAQGLSTKAQEAARAMLRWVEEQHNLEELKAAYAFCAQVAILQGEVEQASQWCELAGEQEVLCPMRFLEDPPR
jgi:LuxR family transcriptional regulator, maltose regulon positive regulatory protein